MLQKHFSMSSSHSLLEFHVSRFTNRPRDPFAERTSVDPLMLWVFCLLLGFAGSALAQPISTGPRLDIFPNPARATLPVQVVFSSFTISCTGEPTLHEVSRESGRVVLELTDPVCPLLPPDGSEYRIVKELEPLGVGTTTIEVREPGGFFVAETEVVVTALETDELQAIPIQTRFEDRETSVIRLQGTTGGCLVGVESIDIAPVPDDLSAGPTAVDIRLERGCILDPPLAQDFTFDIELGQLTPGLYAVTAEFDGAERSRTRLFEVFVDTTPPSLGVSPTEPIDTDSIQISITRPGQLACDPNAALDVGSGRIDVRVDSDCWAAPFDQSSTVFVSLGQRPSGRYLLALLERGTNEELDRRIFDIAPEGNCVESATTLCLMRNRFRATALWSTTLGTQGPGHATLRSDGTSAASGTFWFFDPSSVEIDLKVINACDINGQFWIFAAGLTDQGVRLVVEDTTTGDVKTYRHLAGTPFQTVTDITALPCLLVF